MLKLIGAVMIFGSCAALGLSARQSLLDLPARYLL